MKEADKFFNEILDMIEENTKQETYTRYEVRQLLFKAIEKALKLMMQNRG